MKKIYAKPNVKVLSVMPFCILQASREEFQYLKNAGGREADDRFDWGTSDDEEYTPTAPQTAW